MRSRDRLLAILAVKHTRPVPALPDAGRHAGEAAGCCPLATACRVCAAAARCAETVGRRGASSKPLPAPFARKGAGNGLPARPRARVGAWAQRPAAPVCVHRGPKRRLFETPPCARLVSAKEALRKGVSRRLLGVLCVRVTLRRSLLPEAQTLLTHTALAPSAQPTEREPASGSRNQPCKASARRLSSAASTSGRSDGILASPQEPFVSAQRPGAHKPLRY